MDVPTLITDVETQIKVSNISSGFPANGTIGKQLRGQSLGGTTTNNIMLEMQRQAKFLQRISSIAFEDLNETEDSQENQFLTAVQKIDDVQYSFYIPISEVAKNIQAVEVNDQQISELANQYKIEPGQTYIIVNDKKYIVTMDIPMHFNRDNDSNLLVKAGIFIIGDTTLASVIAGIASQFGGDFAIAFRNLTKDLLKNLVRVIWSVAKFTFKFFTRFIAQLIAGDGAGVALRAAFTEGVTAFEGLELSTVLWTFAGVIFVVAVIVIMELILHESYQVVYVYNLTKYNVQLSLPYIDYGKLMRSLEGGQSTIPAASEKSTGGVPLGISYNGVAFGFSSDSIIHGLGYTIKILVTDPITAQLIQEIPCLFDVPYGADNSLYVNMDTPSSYKNFYKSNDGKYKQTQYSVQSSSNNLEAVVTYDYLSGKHPDPQTGQDMYLYNSLVVIREKP